HGVARPCVGQLTAIEQGGDQYHGQGDGQQGNQQCHAALPDRPPHGTTPPGPVGDSGNSPAGEVAMVPFAPTPCDGKVDGKATTRRSSPRSSRVRRNSTARGRTSSGVSRGGQRSSHAPLLSR